MYSQQLYLCKGGKRYAKYDIENKIHVDQIKEQDHKKESRIKKCKELSSSHFYSEADKADLEFH